MGKNKKRKGPEEENNNDKSLTNEMDEKNTSREDMPDKKEDNLVKKDQTNLTSAKEEVLEAEKPSNEDAQIDDNKDKSVKNDSSENKEEKTKSKSGIIIGAIFALIVILLIVGSVYTNNIKNKMDDKYNKDIIITTEPVGEFVKTGQFTIEGLKGFPKEEVQSDIEFEPKVDFAIEKTDNDNYLVSFTGYRPIAYAGTFKYIDKQGQEKQEVFTVNGPPHKINLLTFNVEPDKPVKLRLSEQVDPRSFEQNLTITPKTEYRIGYDTDYVTIYPAEQWEKTAQYEISIKEDYTSKTGKQLAYGQKFNFAVVKPESEGGGKYYPEIIYHNDNNFIVTQDVKLAISFTGQALKGEVPIVLETYKLGTVDKFKSQAEVYLDYSVSLDTLEKVGTEAFAIVEGSNRFEINNPGLGAFIVRSLVEDPNKPGEKLEFRAGYLITPYSIYMQSSRTETLAWVQNSDTAGPVEGYTFMLGDSEEHSAKTNESGVAVVPNVSSTLKKDANDDNYYYRNYDSQVGEISLYDRDGELVYYDNADLRAKSENNRTLYYRYLYLDRSIYRPTDTINFWGFVKPFHDENNEKMPETVNVVFDPEGMNIKTEAKVNESGIYTGQIKIEQIKSSDYAIETTISVVDKDGKESVVNLSYDYVSVKNFQKPSYLIESTNNKLFYTDGEEMDIDVKATFYDGTPLPNYTLEVFAQTGSYDWKQLESITTDENGNARFKMKATGDRDYGVGTSAYRVQISSDGEQIQHVGYYEYISTKYILEQKLTKPENATNLQLEINTYNIDVDSDKFIEAYKKRKEECYYSVYNIFYDDEMKNLAKGTPADIDVNIALRWKYTDENNIEHANRSYYNEDYYQFTNNYSLDYKIIPKYDGKIIKDWETSEKKITITTKDGKAIIDDVIYLPEGTKIDFSKDVACRSVANIKSDNYISSTVFYPSASEFYDWSYGSDGDDESKGFTFEVTDKETGKDMTPTTSYYREVVMDIGKPAIFKVLLNGKELPANGMLFYSIIQNGMVDYKVVHSNQFELAYDMAFSPEAALTAAYFDGYRVYYVNDINISASEESRTVDIEVTPDKENYRPGETAKIKVKATDVNGKGVAGNMVVSVVDEAIFAISDQYIDVLREINGDLWSVDNYVTKYCTTLRGGGVKYGGPAGSGGKGDGDGGEFYNSYRSNFKDTAYFISTRTDSNGESEVEFVMPDNITSWRITAIEIGDKLYAGQVKENVVTTMPFFVKPVTSSKYIDGDEISLLVQGHGISVKEGDSISYDVTLKGDKYEKNLKYEEKARQAVEFNFGKLPIGTYTLIAKASHGGNSDTVEIPVYVIKNNLELVVNTPIKIPLNKQLDIPAARYPVTLSIYDKESAPFFKTVNSLFGHYCMMPSQRLSRFTAKKVLIGTLPEDEIPYYIVQGNDSIADMQQSDGGIGAAAGEPSELMLSMYLTLIEKEQFNQTALTEYYENTLVGNKDEKEKATAYLGLAVLGKLKKETILRELGIDENGKVVNDKKLTDDIKAYYIAALAYMDEQSLAKKLYEQDLQPRLKNLTQPSEYYYRYNEKDLERERDLASIWIAASKINLSDADKLSDYFAVSHWRYRTLFEGMIYVVNYDRKIIPSKFSYTMNGETHDKVVGPTGMTSISLNKSELEDIRFTRIDDSVEAFAYYVGEPTELGIEGSDNISVTKKIEPVDDKTYKVTIALTLDEDAPTGEYDITDWIPSNSRLYQRYKTSYNRDNYYSYMRTEEQKVYIMYYHGKAEARTETITYLIRQTYSANAVLDSVYVIHGESGTNTNSEKSEFKPENSEFKTPIVFAK